MKLKWIILLVLFTGFNMKCANPCSTGGGSKVSVSWDPPHSVEMTTVPGGGHRIYYSFKQGVNTLSSMVDVPYSQSPTSGVITGLSSGCTYYFRVQAYSALNPSGGHLSDETSIRVP